MYAISGYQVRQCNIVVDQQAAVIATSQFAQGAGAGHLFGHGAYLVAVLHNPAAAAQCCFNLSQQNIAVSAFRRNGVETAQLIQHLFSLPLRRVPRKNGQE